MSFKNIDNPFYKKKMITYKVYLNSIRIDDEKIQKYKSETLTKTYIYIL